MQKLDVLSLGLTSSPHGKSKTVAEIVRLSQFPYCSTHPGFPKPNNLKYTDYINRCALSLQQEMEVATDEFLPSLIRLNHLTEDVNTMYRMESSDYQNELIEARLKTHLQNFQLQLQDWESSLTRNARQYRT